MTLNDTLKGLKYIADSPPHSHGGFHPQTIQIAKMAIFHINNLKDNLNQPHLKKGNPTLKVKIPAMIKARVVCSARDLKSDRYCFVCAGQFGRYDNNLDGYIFQTISQSLFIPRDNILSSNKFEIVN